MAGYGHGGTGAGCKGSERARLMTEGTLQWEWHWTRARTTRTAGETGHALGGGSTEARQQRVRKVRGGGSGHGRSRAVGAAATVQDANRGRTLLGLTAAVAQAGRGKKK